MVRLTIASNPTVLSARSPSIATIARKMRSLPSATASTLDIPLQKPGKDPTDPSIIPLHTLRTHRCLAVAYAARMRVADVDQEHAYEIEWIVSAGRFYGVSRTVRIHCV